MNSNKKRNYWRVASQHSTAKLLHEGSPFYGRRPQKRSIIPVSFVTKVEPSRNVRVSTATPNLARISRKLRAEKDPKIDKSQQRARSKPDDDDSFHGGTDTAHDDGNQAEIYRGKSGGKGTCCRLRLSTRKLPRAPARLSETSLRPSVSFTELRQVTAPEGRVGTFNRQRNFHLTPLAHPAPPAKRNVPE